MRDREEVMARLDDSFVSHVSLADSESGDNALKMQELVSGIEAREKILVAK